MNQFEHHKQKTNKYTTFTGSITTQANSLFNMDYNTKDRKVKNDG
jgi:hypothetical protein